MLTEVFTFVDAKTPSGGTVFSAEAVCLRRDSFSASKISTLSFRLKIFKFTQLCLRKEKECTKMRELFSSQDRTCLTLETLWRLLKRPKPAGARPDFRIQGLTGSYVI